jgi:hypothetical protein
MNWSKEQKDTIGKFAAASGSSWGPELDKMVSDFNEELEKGHAWDVAEAAREKARAARRAEENASWISNEMKSLQRGVRNVRTVLGGGLGGLVGAGAGFATRAAFEDKMKKQKDKTFMDGVLAYAPLIGGVGGIALGAGLGRGLSKVGSLNPTVQLKDHQQRAINRLEENNGSLLVAHATGTGKTLTGIAAFEKLKSEGKAKRAIVVVPASLRENFVQNGVKKFTNSSAAAFGPKNEASSKNIGDSSSADYNVVSYELFREHGDKILEGTGADTLIMDEVHRVRGDEGVTYNKLRELRPKFKQAITLTGSVVNNQPNDVVPLLDITYTPEGHKLVNKSFFDKLFVDKKTKTTGFLGGGKVVIEKNIKNKNALSKYLEGKIDYIPHDHPALEKDLPTKGVEEIITPMTKEQTDLYRYSMNAIDPLTRWKIRNNIPVDQREAGQLFGQLLKARQVSTDPGVMSTELAGKNPYDYSPKIRRVVDDAKEHLAKDNTNKTVIYGNLIKGQLEGVEKALNSQNMPYSKFFGTGQEGVTQKTRTKAISDFQKGDKRILLISGAGAEGLDLKETNLMQMVEGHYNPERIQQAEARIRRLGSFANLPQEERKIQIKRYHSEPTTSGFGKLIGSIGKPLGVGGDQGVDKWVYSIAKRKDDLNKQFREVVEGQQKTAGLWEFVKKNPAVVGPVAMGVGALASSPVASMIEKGTNTQVEQAIKQKLIDKGYESLAQKRHYDKILAEGKVDEAIQDAQVAGSLLGFAGMTGYRWWEIEKGIAQQKERIKNILTRKPIEQPNLALTALKGVAAGAAPAILSTLAARQLVKGLSSVNAGKKMDSMIESYLEKLRKKHERKYKGSKSFVNEYETKKELGIDQAL